MDASVDGMILMFVLLALIVFFALLVSDDKRTQTWRVVAEGDFDRVEYERRYHKARYGIFLYPREFSYLRPVTIVRFLDGRSYVISDQIPVRCAKGTPVKILSNDRGEYRVEILEKASGIKTDRKGG